MGKLIRRAKSALKKGRNVVARSKALGLASKALPVLGVAMGPLGRTAGVKLGAALGGAQRIAKVSKGDFSQELAQAKQLGSILGGNTGKAIDAGSALFSDGKKKAKMAKQKVSTKPSAEAQKKAAQAAVAGKAAVIVQAKSGRKYRVSRVG